MLQPDDSRYLARLMPYVREVLKVPDLIVFMEAVGKTDDLKKLPKQQQDMIKKAEDLKKKLEGTKDELY
jgi:hypothetical protein